ALRCGGEALRLPWRGASFGRRERHRARVLRPSRLHRRTAQHALRGQRMAQQHHDEEGADGARGIGMSKERIYLFDTTLRDGAQTDGVDFTLADKLAIARMLDDLGLDYVEGG